MYKIHKSALSPALMQARVLWTTKTVEKQVIYALSTIKKAAIEPRDS